MKINFWNRDKKKEKRKRKEKEKEEKIQDLIKSIFDKEKQENQIELIKKLRPFFSLKVIPNNNLDKFYSIIETIAPENIDIIEDYKYKEEKYQSNNEFETNQKSFGLKDAQLNLSINIYGNKIKSSIKFKKVENETNAKIGSIFYCKHSYIVSLLRIVINPKYIKLIEQITKEFNKLKNKKETEKKALLEKLIDKYGLYIPLELLIGGRIDFYFNCNNEFEINTIHNYLQAKINGESDIICGEFNNKDNKNCLKQSKQIIENIKTEVLGGDYLYKDDIDEWIISFTLNNLQIIEYKNLIPIYCFIEGLEDELNLCVRNYEEIVLQQIHKLISEEYKEKEADLYKGSSSEKESWEIGLTKEIYNTFVILKKSYSKKISLKDSQKKYIISGEILKKFIICGWKIYTNTNSNERDVICNWERKKENSIIGNRIFKFNIIIP